jgi:hypothetical protein
MLCLGRQSDSVSDSVCIAGCNTSSDLELHTVHGEQHTHGTNEPSCLCTSFLPDRR